VNGQRRFNGFCFLILILLMMPYFLVEDTHGLGVKSLVDFLLTLAMAGVGVWVALELFVLRIESDDDRMRAFDLLNRKTADLAYGEITSYTKEAGVAWTLKQGDKVIRIPRVDRQQFHSLIAEKVPKALKAKLWKCGQLPPAQDFTALSLFDWNAWITNAMGAVFVSLLFLLFSKGFAAFYFISSILQTSYHLKDLFGKLNITTEGVSIQWPWEKRAILWDEISAIFCEKGADRSSYFVVTAPQRFITIPPHVLSDPEVRRKFFYSIPDRTRCVNFENIRFRRRRGKGKRVMFGEESYGTLEPLGPLPS
jgi:hypothetical protein